MTGWAVLAILVFGAIPKSQKKLNATRMGHSFYQVSRENAAEDWTNRNNFYHEPSGTHYQMLERAGVYYQRRYQIGFGGA